MVDYPPYYFQDDQNSIRGISAEVAQVLAKQLGHKLVYKRYPFGRVVLYLQTGKADMVCQFFNTPDRAKAAIYTGVPHVFESAWMFIKKGNKISYQKDLKQLQNYRFGGVIGYSFGKAYDTADYLNKQHAVSEQEQIKMLLAGRFDIALGTKQTIIYHAKKMQILDQIEFLTPTLADSPVYMAFSRARNDAYELATTFTEALVEYKKTAEYRQLLKKYHFEYPTFDSTN
ncbi:transporter substrate-binding domain-containing protein [Endozoicomonas sp. SM1973]|uniref:Transporter substrate-binding domain-containing protein n=1 Tax=Spartinivicinus marinus TaxID=2994442 RepID=A0A853IDM2_9GAMM|nr:transporter substrate-binding domain-containing protein [Spartinivicinus marinus]MCX4025832.1 transporter substrate-binding domain-containing protein [Spartinivicinus marinus]NYZ68648.1 transporter substrate-binding domain-containing protein [Spartinivicinus marinus]